MSIKRRPSVTNVDLLRMGILFLSFSLHMSFFLTHTSPVHTSPLPYSIQLLLFMLSGLSFRLALFVSTVFEMFCWLCVCVCVCVLNRIALPVRCSYFIIPFDFLSSNKK
ncbi:hypothetical protein BDB00DRAFT_852431 [Zychaea mexicana]|uniref:uncharacterized protein n=1 Tax=Zychaea mexicana TaxID=64656 RepID=UPI0022FF128F|nr:uncharacterized protein BDB00DRAFT_852431 [Zychaea mexicana]KAI9484972.1 hypothetical protein BDB00DRAFT_852431 [Zychaea mexicana]